MMKKLLLPGFALLFILSCGEKQEETTPSAEETKEKSVQISTFPVNRYCLIEPERRIDRDVTVVHKGKTYGFCCADCIPVFNKDPEKYIRLFEERERETGRE